MENIYSNNKKKNFRLYVSSYQKMKRKEKKRYNRNNSRTIKLRDKKYIFT